LGFLVLRKFRLSYKILKDDKATPVSEIQLFKFGEFDHWSGSEFAVDADFCEQVIANFERMKANAKDDKFLPMDYNHGSLAYGPEEAKASGWILELSQKDDGLYAKVEWTVNAAEYIKNGEYRYISPEFADEYQNEYGESFEGAVLLAAALTNRPFLKGMAPATLSDKNKNRKGEESMNLKESIAKALGLSGEVDDKQILSALTKVSAPLVEARQALGLSEGDDLVSGIKKLLAERETSKSEVKLLSDRVEKLVQDGKIITATQKVEKLLSEKRLIPAQRDVMIKIASETPENFEALTKDLPVLAALTPPAGGGSSEGPNDKGDSVQAEFDKAVNLKLSAKPSLTYLAASREVQAENKDLAKRYAESSRPKN
jgi:phage I-like protein